MILLQPSTTLLPYTTLFRSDQLRMRMAFALSEIMVVSDREVADGNATVFRIADYQDTLARGAFGSYRTLLEKVSVHPDRKSTTSELQSHVNLVCRLLLEKKK